MVLVVFRTLCPDIDMIIFFYQLSCEQNVEPTTA